MPPRRRLLLLLLPALLAAGLACNLSGAATTGDAPAPTSTSPDTGAPATSTALPATETPIPATPTVAHLVTPAEPPAEQFFLGDVSSGGNDHVTRAKAGDNYTRNRLERPFTAQGPVYRPELDVVHMGISADDVWFYFHLELYGAPGAVTYGVELDLDADGRGDLMVRAASPTSAAWTTDGVQAYTDANGDVGGPTPMTADPADPARDGYETMVFDQGQGDDPDAAWVRVAPDGQTVQFAVKRALVADAAFLWGGWADEGVNQPGWIDYHDRFSAAEAGSFDAGLGAVSAVDNTCRMYYGFTPTGSEPGLCAVTGTVRNCSPHPMRMEPGGKMLTPWFEGGAILKNVQIGTYSFYDESTGGTLVLTATLSPGGTITITKTGLGDTYPCQ